MDEAQNLKAFQDWLKAYSGGGDLWRANVLMGEHDIALALWKDKQRQIERLQGAGKPESVAQPLQREIDRLRSALRWIAYTKAMDYEYQNKAFEALSSTARTES